MKTQLLVALLKTCTSPTGASQTLVECSGEDNPTLTASPKSLARTHAAAETIFVCYRDQEGTLRPLTLTPAPSQSSASYQ